MDMDKIRTDCYLAVLDKFEMQYPEAKFEIITRKKPPFLVHAIAMNSSIMVDAGFEETNVTWAPVLSPEWDLLNKAKSEKWNIDRYYDHLEYQLLRSVDSIKYLNYLKDLVQIEEKIVFLVCFEKDASQCHRTLVKRMMEYTCLDCEAHSERYEEDDENEEFDGRTAVKLVHVCDTKDDKWDDGDSSLNICRFFQKLDCLN